jgi:fused signal recognition particle receptor
VIDKSKKPYVILVVGVNGNGKTTSIGKLANNLKQDGNKVLVAAADTFRAAAIGQLKTWAERAGVEIFAGNENQDPASVAYQAIEKASAENFDVVLVDTAGRLQNKSNLMAELAKIKNICAKFSPDSPHEVILVLDATTGQNAINQAKEFNAAVGLTGIILTKLDGTAKGGIIFALASQLGLPIRYIGIGEKAEDLRPFNAESFVQALLGQAELDSSH